jgi:hypothetical protein
MDKHSRAQCYKTFLVRNLQIFKLSYNVCYNGLKKLAKDEHSNLLQKIVDYCNFLNTFGPW